MIPILSLYDKKSISIIEKRNSIDKIRLILTGSLIKNPFLLQQKFNFEKNEILKGSGLTYQTIRQENPRLANHNFLKQFFFINDLKKMTFEEKKVILENLKQAYFLIPLKV
jgi:hypothetical protein